MVGLLYSGFYYYNVISLPRGYSRWSSEIESANANGIQYNKQYKCTAYKECLKEVPYHIKDKRKCIDDCKNDDTYKESFEPVITGYATAINDENFENENSKNSSEKMKP